MSFNPLNVEHSSMTDVGIRRSHNQDAHMVVMASDIEAYEKHGHVLLVADGMGGHAVGELASKLAADHIPDTYLKYAGVEGVVPALKRAIETGNNIIHTRGQQNPEFSGMGTTTTMLILRPEGVWLTHVGDSRAYRIRSGRIEQLSYDHSLQWEIARRQRVAPESVSEVRSNVIIRSLGPESSVKPDIEGPHPILSGDTFLLCSDGLCGVLSDAQMGMVVGALPLDEACRLLVDLANLRGGPDNITVILARMPGETPDAAPTDDHPATKTKSHPWDNRFQSPSVTLEIGMGMAMLAFLFVALQWQRLAIVVFCVAVLVVLAGLYLLYRSFRESANLELAEADAQGPHIYRHQSCKPNEGMITELHQLHQSLVRQLNLHQLGYDHDRFVEHVQKSQHAQAEGDLPLAATEVLRSIQVLMEVVRPRLSKGEVFQPNYEQSANEAETENVAKN